ncbi:RagB/SusD family nutrient uptake outer membrane protein [Pontibacter litorisediminis]|uniref:RagB/SusD family nutrient uptake outer membrane protein n=1 Tax=Pontibacter litorisediminis TaxID=1846260 RepID=UPI0023ECE34D|nr:RagB/SusD family nutrient uptake outer membrane protein [Pontibacter litorisediminis]
MKSLIRKSLVVLGCASVGAFASCTDLDEEVYSDYTEQNFPSTPEQYAALTGPVYVAAQKFFDNNFYDLQETATDEVVVPTRGGDWFDGGKWRAMHLHTWTPSHELMRNSWDWGFNAIGTANRILTQLETAPESDNKRQTIAEVKTMRAWYYYNMMDAFGNIPVVTTFDDNAAAPMQMPRAEVAAFIAAELEENLQYLTEEVSPTTYGRPTKWMAHTLLAKLYLNSEVYTGKATAPDGELYWDKVVKHADAVINSGKYALESNYFDMFKPTNGPQNREPIFSIPFDAVKAKGNLLYNKVLHYAHRDTYGLTTNPWNGWTTTPSFFNLFADQDIRKQQWLYGQQLNASGDNLVYNGVNVVLDPYYFPAFDVGGEDDLGRLAGARNIKYLPDPNAVNFNANNDVVIFRYADVLLMKAEAILRGSSLGSRADALALVNQVRDRAFNDNPEFRYTDANLTLQNIYNERGREFALEMTRRTDMIRFGRFEDEILFKPANPGETYKRLFPIPATAIASNPNLVQNPGY